MNDEANREGQQGKSSEIKKKKANRGGAADGQGGTPPSRNFREVSGGGRIYKSINLRERTGRRERRKGMPRGEKGRKSPREKEGGRAESVARIYGGRRKKQKQNAVEFLFPAVVEAFRCTVRLAVVSCADLEFGGMNIPSINNVRWLCIIF